MATLVVKTKSFEKAYSLNAPYVFIGRGPKCSLQIDEEGVAVMHCKIVKEGNSYKIIDLGSQRGTFVNGSRITERTLKNLDALQIGTATVTFHENAERITTRREDMRPATAQFKPATATLQPLGQQTQDMRPQTQGVNPLTNNPQGKVTTARRLVAAPQSPTTPQAVPVASQNPQTGRFTQKPMTAKIVQTPQTGSFVQPVSTPVVRVPTARIIQPAQGVPLPVAPIPLQPAPTRKVTSSRYPGRGNARITSQRRVTTNRSNVGGLQTARVRRKKSPIFVLMILGLLGLAGFAVYILVKPIIEGDTLEALDKSMNEIVKTYLDTQKYNTLISDIGTCLKDKTKNADLVKKIDELLKDFKNIRKYDEAISKLEEKCKKLREKDPKKGNEWGEKIKEYNSMKSDEPKKLHDLKDLAMKYNEWKGGYEKEPLKQRLITNIELKIGQEEKRVNDDYYRDPYKQFVEDIISKLRSIASKIGSKMFDWKKQEEIVEQHYNAKRYKEAIDELRKIDSKPEDVRRAKKSIKSYLEEALGELTSFKEKVVSAGSDKEKILKLKQEFETMQKHFDGITKEEINKIFDEDTNKAIEESSKVIDSLNKELAEIRDKFK